MRCQCCDKNLSDYESSLRSSVTGQYLDMCGTCISESDITPVAYTRSVIADVQEDSEDCCIVYGESDDCL